MQKIKDWMGAIDIARWLGVLASYIWCGVKKVRDSMITFVASPKVWLAAAVFALAGYWAGHMLMAGKVRSLDVTASALARDKIALNTEMEVLRGKNRDLSQKLADAMKPPMMAAVEPPTAPAPVPPPKPKKVKIPVKQEGSFWALFQ